MFTVKQEAFSCSSAQERCPVYKMGSSSDTSSPIDMCSHRKLNFSEREHLTPTDTKDPVRNARAF